MVNFSRPCFVRHHTADPKPSSQCVKQNAIELGIEVQPADGGKTFVVVDPAVDVCGPCLLGSRARVWVGCRVGRGMWWTQGSSVALRTCPLAVGPPTSLTPVPRPHLGVNIPENDMEFQGSESIKEGFGGGLIPSLP